MNRRRTAGEPAGILEMNRNVSRAGSTLIQLVFCKQNDAVCHDAAAEPPPMLSELVWSSLVSVGGEVGCVIRG